MKNNDNHIDTSNEISYRFLCYEEISSKKLNFICNFIRKPTIHMNFHVTYMIVIPHEWAVGLYPEPAEITI